MGFSALNSALPKFRVMEKHFLSLSRLLGFDCGKSQSNLQKQINSKYKNAKLEAEIESRSFFLWGFILSKFEVQKFETKPKLDANHYKVTKSKSFNVPHGTCLLLQQYLFYNIFQDAKNLCQ